MPERMVADLMTEKPYAVRPGEGLDRVLELMSERSIRHVPVVDAEGDLVGLITHRDLVSLLHRLDQNLPLSLRKDVLAARRVRDLMQTRLETVAPDDDLRAAAEIMLENKYGCLLVTEGDRLVGILTEADFVQAYVDEG